MGSFVHGIGVAASGPQPIKLLVIFLAVKNFNATNKASSSRPQ